MMSVKRQYYLFLPSGESCSTAAVELIQGLLLKQPLHFGHCADSESGSVSVLIEERPSEQADERRRAATNLCRRSWPEWACSRPTTHIVTCGP